METKEQNIEQTVESKNLYRIAYYESQSTHRIVRSGTYTIDELVKLEAFKNMLTSLAENPCAFIRVEKANTSSNVNLGF